jgi:glycolate oxidase iron-sulfur subunit
MTLDPVLLDQCVGCGLCLSSCPTFSVTRLEQHGPRGRIEGMRLVQDGSFDVLDPDYVASMETCVQCRSCEDVCPSDVEFGALMEQARADIVTARAATGPQRGLRAVAQRGLLAMAAHPVLRRVLTALLVLAQRTRLDRLLPTSFRVATRVRPTRLPARSEQQADTHLFRGCVMDSWFGDVHAATYRVLRASGHQVDSRRRGTCCGALHLHAGETERALGLARQTIAAHAGTEGPIVVNSAGCGAAMKEYGRLLGTPEAHQFAARVRDFGEAIDPSRLQLREGPSRRLAWQAPCHLRYVQKADDAAREALETIPGVTVVESDDRQMCCGAGGAYSLLEPEFSEAMRERKCASLRRTGCEAVISANPGCSLQLASGGLHVLHLAQVIAAALPVEDDGNWSEGDEGS